MFKYTVIFSLIAFLSFNKNYSQNVMPNESQKERTERKIEERKQEYINNFLFTLNADDFQKEIIRQKLNSFFEEKIALGKQRYNRSFEYQEAVRKLEDNHFKDIEALLTEENMTKIKEMVKGDFDEKEVIKEKKKKKEKKEKN
ncbi:hypothetical protein FJ651_12730 [Paucihalobacter ruber]|uniref:Uncharacterized protein n=1 Tax=Paucihalobacter ruber TaxID=2567861 RepID=A0A506PEQ4_9FLAO|nr:hypothetical protein [Paucihalobacter ruber]TPV32421.1 hypothetical protein FJ651_12730 [Paucihalobacter ruber]